jgi:hypothetical protein
VDEKGFRAFVAEGKRVRKDLDEGTIRASLKLIRRFERFLSKRRPGRDFRKATKRDLEAFVRELGESNEANYENLLALVRYARFANNKAVEASVIEMLDGAEVMEVLAGILKDRIGSRGRDDIFCGIDLPSIGSSHKGWPKVTKEIMDRLESKLDESTWKGALLAGPHTAPDEYYLPEKRRYEGSGGLDKFLSARADEFLALLKQCRDEGTLFFNQEIDDEALSYVKSNREIGGGVRKGDIIYETKIPYMVREYLREEDPRMRRYYACHCPWVREAIRSGLQVSPNFCYCSAAYHKKPWDVIFDEPVDVEVVSSVLKGDETCRFAIKIPEKHRVRRRERRS